MSETTALTLETYSALQAHETQQMSYAAFLEWNHPGIAEWVNGEVTIMSVKNEHQRVVDFLNRVIGFFVEMFGLGILRSAPYVMRTAEDASGREPDPTNSAPSSLCWMRRDIAIALCPLATTTCIAPA